MSAPTRLIQSNTIDSQQATPWVSVGFYSFTYPDTFISKGTSLDTTAAAISTFRTLVVSDPLSVTVSNSKGGLDNTAEIVLSPGDINYAYRLSPGDWAFVWMHNDITHFDRVNNAVLNRQAANDYDSGLKFVGRIFSVREVNTNNNGIKTVRYHIALRGFTEFESQIYYNPQLAAADDTALKFLAKLSDEWNSIIGKDKGATPCDDLLSFFIDLFLGKGPKSIAGKPFPGILRSPNAAFIIPKEVAQIMGVKKPENQVAAYRDLLVPMIGIHNYITPNSFAPSLKKIVGAMIAVPNNFNNVTVWSLLQTVLNQTLNEMYVTLRANENGNIFPHYIARQQPFTTKRYKGNLNVTRFNSIPRWKISPDRQLAGYNLGTTNAVRINFLQVYGQMYSRGNNPQAAMEDQIVSGNYAIDDKDALRSGVRTCVMTSNHDVQVTNGTAVTQVAGWKDLLADWYINLHLKLNGTISVSGISEPICVGDNLEYEGVIYQIESVQHQYAVDGDSPKSTKSFVTTMTLSHGLLTNEEYAYTLGDDRQSYGSTYWPGVSDEELYVNNKPIIGVEGGKVKGKDE